MLLYEFIVGRGLERRKAQEEFFQIVLDAFDKGGTKIVQAPTGTGKTYAYLIPIIEKDQKAIISTGTKMLQEQLRKDIEALKGYAKYLLNKDVSYLILKGKSNYLCLDRYYSNQKVDLESYINSQWDGDYEFVSLPAEVWLEICVDDDYCDSHYRGMCKYRKECYYWGRLKEMEKRAQILVVNHALLSLKEFENPKERVLVIDEAHELDKYITSSLTTSLSLYALRMEVLGRIRSFLPEANVDVEGFFIENFERLFKEKEEEIPIESLKPYKESFERDILSPIESLYKRVREKVLEDLEDFLEGRLFVSLKFKDYLLKLGIVGWERYLALNSNYEDPSEEEEALIKRIKTYELLSKYITKLRNFSLLMGEDSTNFGYLVGRRWSKKLRTFNYWIGLFPVFPKDYVDFSDYKAVIITSATADPEDLRLTLGIEGEYYELSHPFPYHRVNFLVYDVDPREEEWAMYLKHAYKYLRSLYHKVLILLTNKEQRVIFEREEGLAFQGEEGLSKLVQDLREGKIKALAGFDSLWLGVDVPGEKGLLMAKLPFESPEEPITFHRIRFLKEQGVNPFEYQKRKALIKFRQGIGRLMRTKDDGGTIILCDRRIYKFKEFLHVLDKLGIKAIKLPRKSILNYNS
ncbi:MAG: ATP-dependent DNA helicase [Aquificaceae bacterium]